MRRRIGRRTFLIGTAGGIFPTALFSQGADGLPRILASFSFGRGIYYFNPAGLYVDVGQPVQWAGLGTSRSVVAFHPSIDNHELRIPENAEPFDSRKVPSDSGTFVWRFDVEGTYDYYSQPEEYLGMVGRIVVGKPGGRGERPPGDGNREGRGVMYPDVARLLEYLKPEDIVRKKIIPCPLELLERRFPWR